MLNALVTKKATKLGWVVNNLLWNCLIHQTIPHSKAESRCFLILTCATDLSCHWDPSPLCHDANNQLFNQKFLIWHTATRTHDEFVHITRKEGVTSFGDSQLNFDSWSWHALGLSDCCRMPHCSHAVCSWNWEHCGTCHNNLLQLFCVISTNEPGPALLKFLAMLVRRPNCWPAQSLTTFLEIQSIMLLLTCLKSTSQCAICFLSLVHQRRSLCHVALTCLNLCAAPVSLWNRTDPLQVKILVQMNDVLHAPVHKTVCKWLQVSSQFWCQLLFFWCRERKDRNMIYFQIKHHDHPPFFCKNNNIATLFSFMLQQSGRVGNSCCKNSIHPLFFKHASPQL